MFDDELLDDATGVLLLAREEAAALGDDHLRPAHLLLGTAANDRVRAAVQPQLSVTEFRLRVNQLRDAD
ncbi:MAG: hypothetical protein JWN03_4507 [Nocardia sp.]|uniref:hypothetical protein n=1 Tax=Nocardia sp. TaxID=1821 RepID=UPI002619B284|nr:hypothetical protein [Nocardia sp.]MCU1644232.1 hypothetical protein [Nocardia sp.]